MSAQPRHRPPVRRTTELAVAAVKAYKTMTIREIAAQQKRSYGSVHRDLTEANVEMRSVGGQPGQTRPKAKPGERPPAGGMRARTSGRLTKGGRWRSCAGFHASAPTPQATSPRGQRRPHG